MTQEIQSDPIAPVRVEPHFGFQQRRGRRVRVRLPQLVVFIGDEQVALVGDKPGSPVNPTVQLFPDEVAVVAKAVAEYWESESGEAVNQVKVSPGPPDEGDIPQPGDAVRVDEDEPYADDEPADDDSQK